MVQRGINLDLSLWDNVPTELSEGKWLSCSFRPDSIGFISRKGPIRGVYMVVLMAEKLFKREPLNLINSIVYIGNSTDIRKRFKQHTNETRTNTKNISLKLKLSKHKHIRFWYLELSNHSQSMLLEKEQFLIDIFGSPLNRINAVSIGTKIVKDVLVGTLNEGKAL